METQIFSNIKKVIAFSERYLKILLSYKFALITIFVSPLLWVFLFGMFGKMFKDIRIPAIAQYGGNYIPYIIIGVVFWQFVTLGLSRLAIELREEMSIGTLEAIFMTPTNLAVALSGVSLVSLLLATIFTFVAIGLGTLIFNFSIGGGNYFLVFLIIFLNYISTVGIGMVVAGLTLIYKNIGVFVGILTTLMMFFSGVYFPVEILPSFLRPISYVLPLTHALHSLRLVLLRGAGLKEVLNPVISLSVISIITIIMGYIYFGMAIEKVRKEGGFGIY